MSGYFIHCPLGALIEKPLRRRIREAKTKADRQKNLQASILVDGTSGTVT
jgi:hypothetical protein